MHAYVCKPLYKYQCICDCMHVCIQHQWTQMTQRGVLTQRRPSAGQTAGAAVNLVLLVQIQLLISSESHLKLMQMFITWQRRLWRFSSVSPGTGVSSLTLRSWLWIFNGAERLGWGAVVSGPVRAWALRFRRSTGPMWVSAAVERQKHRDGWCRQIPAAETLPSRCAVRLGSGSVTYDSAGADDDVDDDEDAAAAHRINTHNSQTAAVFSCISSRDSWWQHACA